jgi:hypothetical protein
LLRLAGARISSAVMPDLSQVIGALSVVGDVEALELGLLDTI